MLTILYEYRHSVFVVGLRALRSGGLYGREQFITLLFNYH